MEQTEVLIVGAGPTGLTLAIELRRLGVPFRLVDKAPHPAQYSQALVVQARTLEQFERYGLAAAAVRQGRRMLQASLFSEGKPVAVITLERGIPGHYPFALFLPQKDTEALLIRHLESLGGAVERQVELAGFTTTDQGVEAELRGPGGAATRLAARWVVGCDGAHSAVREGAQIPFTGTSVAMNFFLGDLVLEGPDLPGDGLVIYLRQGDVVFMGRLKENVVRLIIALHGEQGAKDQRKEVTLADFQGALDLAGIRLRAVSAEWMTPFRVNERRARHTRRGSVFLAGDAAHIHSPVGGQGMNTGIQDAANLAWKLAAVRSGADPRLLDSYEEERGRVSQQLVRVTSLGLRGGTTTNPLVRGLRDLAMRTIVQLSWVQRRMAGFVSETAIGYRGSSAVIQAGGRGSLRAGDRVPNPELVWKDGRRQRLLDGLQRPGSLLLAVNASHAAQIRARWPQTTALWIDRAELTAGQDELIRLFGPPGGLAVVRPDGYVGFRGDAEALDRLADYALLAGLR